MNIEKIKKSLIYIFTFFFLSIGLSLQFKTSGSIKNYLNSGLYVIQIFSIIASLFCLALGNKIISERKIKSRKIWSIIISIVLAAIICIGRIDETYKSINILYSGKGLFFSFWNITAYSVLMFVVINWLYDWLFKRLDYDDSFFTGSNLKAWALYAVIVIILWSFVLFIFYPGIWGWDGMDQINQFFAMKSDGRQFYLTNHHPYFTTVVMGFLFKLGLSVSTNFGIFLICFINICLFAGIISYLTLLISSLIGKKVALWVYVFFTVFPIFPVWAVVVDKTAYFLESYILFISELLYCWSHLRDSKKINYRHCTALSISGLLVGLTRNDGFLYLLFALIGLIILNHFACENHKLGKRPVLALLTSLVVVLVFNAMLLPLFKVLPTEPMEPMAVPLQQIARVAKTNPTGITSKQRKQLGYYLNYDEMKKNYDPNSFDAIKYTVKFPMWKLTGNFKSRQTQFKNTPIEKNKSKFYKIWLDIGIQNPKIYLDSILTSHIGYVYPSCNGESILIWNAKPLNGGASKYEYTQVVKPYHYRHPKLETVAGQVLSDLSSISMFSVFLSCSFWFWIAALLSCLLLCFSSSENIIWFLQCFVVLGVAFVGPINFGFRYVLPFLILVPIMISILFFDIRSKNKILS